MERVEVQDFAHWMEVFSSKLDRIIELMEVEKPKCAFSTGPYDNRNLKLEEEKKA